MAELIVVGFHGTDRAAEVLNVLEGMQDDWTVDLQDAVAVNRDYKGELKLDDNTQPTEGEGAGIGVLWGSLLGMLIAAPFTGGVSGAVAAGAIAAGALGGGALGAATGALSVDWWRDDIGLTEEFVRSVSSAIGTGDSAVFALIRSTDPEFVAERFRGFGGRILQTTLTPEQSRKLQQVLDGRQLAA